MQDKEIDKQMIQRGIYLKSNPDEQNKNKVVKTDKIVNNKQVIQIDKRYK